MTAVLDDTLLADPAALALADGAGALRAAATAGAQVRSAAQAALDAGVADLAGHRPRALVVLRRPGSSGAAGELLHALLGPQCPVPFVTADLVPGWVGPLDVVVAQSADPEDTELAESVARAVGRGAEVVLSVPAEGPVASAGAGRARFVEPRIPVPPALDLPRALAVGLSVVSALGLWPGDLDPSLEPLADALDAEAERNQPGHEPFMNPAKSLALRLAEHTPLLWGTDPPATAVAGHGATALATHAGVVAYSADIAQAATATALRRAVDLAERSDDVFRDPFDDPGPDAPPVRVVLLATSEEDPGQVATRRTGRGWPADLHHPVDEIARGTRDAGLLRAAVLAARWDAAAVYLGLATRTIEPA
ncbi:SIS domain-containing protein [Pseudonocardia xishanensis]|uniref:Bifunctional glucose-6-phosphate/mannose-6-phosphate isomerase C-terminal domain-containing protein n=1 Tax=Pseudonocardia xishanensis TaxID=630995 RepID=A0ABP8RJ99_9PSEU